MKKMNFKKFVLIMAGLCALSPLACETDKESKGTLKYVFYASKDYETGGKLVTKKPARIYLPAGYDSKDKNTKYPVLYLMHGVGGNVDEWGMTTESSHIKKFMDEQIKAGNVEPFIVVCPNGRSNFDFENTDFSNMQGFYYFGKELRNDLIPYMEKNFNVRTDRDGRAMAGLSMGGMQTINIGLCECLDLISWFGAFSAAPTSYESTKINSIITGKKFNDYKINYFYNICGLQDSIALQSHTAAVENLTAVCSKFVEGENFTWFKTKGTHWFDIWNQGFDNFAQIIFK